MIRKHIMSAECDKEIHENEEYDDDEDDDNDDDDDEEEEDFVPGDDDEDDDNEDIEENYPILEGYLELDPEQKLLYHGQGFRLVSTDPGPWNVLDQTVTPKQESFTLEMVGYCDIEMLTPVSKSRKSTPRKLEVTWTCSDPSTLHEHTTTTTNGNGNVNETRANLKVDHDNTDGGDVTEDKKSSSSSSNEQRNIFYQIYGREVAYDSKCHNSNDIEFRGDYEAGDGKQVSLVTQVRTLSVAASTPMAVAVEDEEDVDVEEEVDHNELIALHEDAGLSVEALRKRYREEQEEDDPEKSGKFASKIQSNNDDDDDDDVEF